MEMAAKSGEHLYVSTSTEGRETIRRDLRELHDRCESYRDDLQLTKWRLQQHVSEWEAFTRAMTDFESWLSEVEDNIGDANVLRATLNEKEATVQACKMLQRDVTAHASVVESLRKSADELSGGAPESVAQLSHRYRRLCADVEVRPPFLSHPSSCNQMYM